MKQENINRFKEIKDNVIQLTKEIDFLNNEYKELKENCDHKYSNEENALSEGEVFTICNICGSVWC